MFPKPDAEGNYRLTDFSIAGLTDLRNMAANQLSTVTASVTAENVTDDQLDEMEQIQGFIAAADAELASRQERAARFERSSQVPTAVTAAGDEDGEDDDDDAAVTADGEPEFDADGNKNVSDTVVAPDVANTATEVVEATITAAGGKAPKRAVTLADVAPHAPAEQVMTGDDAYSIVAAADIATFPTGADLTWKSLGKAFEERVRPYGGMRKTVTKGRYQHPLAMIRRNYPEGQVVLETDSHEAAFGKLRTTADTFGKDESLVAANGWCAPSEPDYSICNPITTDGLLNLPEMVLRRGGLLHNQGLDFGDFFGNDFTLPIPGFNILTEAQVIADTAKTCVEIPCPNFVDDRLNVAALCLTSSLLQNRGYPEFVSEFTQGAIAALAHLVNREVINEIATGSVAVDLSTTDPWAVDGTVYSNVLSAVEFAVKDLRYVYRARLSQPMTVVLPYWVLMQMRADYVRRNAAANDDIADAAIMASFRMRGAQVQWVYDWQDAFNPGAIVATQQMGNAVPPLLAPTTLQFLIFLPGTWVLGRQDVIRLDTVYDAANLQQNLVTQLFMEDGFRPMRMCQHSRLYTIPICPSGSTGAQRAVDCETP